MDPVDNPYSPGAGLRPAVLAGRDPELEAFQALLKRGELGRSSRGIILTGLRGVGKTVLLNEFATRADENDWITVQLEVRSQADSATLFALASGLTAGVRRQQGPKVSDLVNRALRSIKAFSLTVDPTGAVSANVDVEATSSGDLELDFARLAVDVGRAAREFGAGAVILLDELQDLGKDAMASLAAAAHSAGQRNVPFYVVGAGLPSLPGRLADAKSYAERLFDYRPLGSLEYATAVQALSAPSGEAGVTWSDDALEASVRAADGYPYFLQEFGAAAWNVAPGPHITAADAANGIRLGQAILDGGFFRSRWDRATATERQYLQAMAAISDGETRTPDVAAGMGRTQSNLGPVRAGLLGKGLIYSPEYGAVAFTVPGMAAFVRRQSDQ